MDTTQGFLKITRPTSYGEVSWTVPVALHECITSLDVNQKMKEATQELDRGLLELDGVKGRPNRSTTEETPQNEEKTEVKEEKRTARKRPTGGEKTEEKRPSRRRPSAEGKEEKRPSRRRPSAEEKTEEKKTSRRRPVAGEKKEEKKTSRKRPVVGANKSTVEKVSKEAVDKWLREEAEETFIDKCNDEGIGYDTDREFDAALKEWLEQEFIRGEFSELYDLPLEAWDDFVQIFSNGGQ